MSGTALRPGFNKKKIFFKNCHRPCTGLEQKDPQKLTATALGPGFNKKIFKDIQYVPFMDGGPDGSYTGRI